MKSKEIGSDVKNDSITYNIREERLKASQENKKLVDVAKENAKKHFEEIFNRI
jgi:hypothetical protein